MDVITAEKTLLVYSTSNIVASPKRSHVIIVFRVISNSEPLNNQLGIYIFAWFMKNIISTEKIKV